MFAGLTDEQLQQLSAIFELHEYQQGEVLFTQGDQGGHLYLVKEGFVEVIATQPDEPQGRTIVNLGQGQSVGEMAFIDHGTRSATVRAAAGGTIVASVSRQSLDALCEEDTSIGYRIMRNIAADLSFRIRRRQFD
jgi:CRP-like cAMP-binding protein